MKNAVQCFLVVCLLVFSSLGWMACTTSPTQDLALPAPTGTSLVIVNATDSATTVVMVLADSGGACDSPVTAQALVDSGYFTGVIDSGVNWPYAAGCTTLLGPHDSIVIPGWANLCLSGNVGFDVEASCACVDFPNGMSIAEFTLNPSTQFETIDISLVNGNSYVLSMEVFGGGIWLMETTNNPMFQIQNLPFPNTNANLPGIYPQNCTNCINVAPPAPCTSMDTVCSDMAICQLQRDNGVGGIVRVSLVSRPDQGTVDSLPPCPSW